MTHLTCQSDREQEVCSALTDDSQQGGGEDGALLDRGQNLAGGVKFAEVYKLL